MFNNFYNYPGFAVPYENLTVPFTVPLPNGMSPGVMIYMRGTPTDDERFAINLTCSEDMDGDEIALHINPRFNEEQIVRNTKEGGGWGSEERHGDFQFSQGETFTLLINCLPDCYQVIVNGDHAFDYPHRMAMESVTHLGVKGGVDIHQLHFQGGYQLGGFADNYAMVGPPMPLYNPELPVYYQLPGGMAPGKMFIVNGTVLEGSNGRFNVNLQHGDDASHVGLHFDVRMNYGSDERVIVRNCKTEDGWGTEEREVPYFPFEYNADFVLMFYCDYDHFKVAVNNNHFIEFPFRMPLRELDTVRVQGDVQVHELRFQ